MAHDEDLLERIAKLEATTEAKWDAHDERSRANWESIKIAMAIQGNKIDGLFSKLSDMAITTVEKCAPCKKGITDDLKKTIALVIGIPATIVTIITAIVEIHRMIR